jgi:hypothetical protein
MEGFYTSTTGFFVGYTTVSAGVVGTWNGLTYPASTTKIVGFVMSTKTA